MTDGNNYLIIIGQSGDTVNFKTSDGWQKGSTQVTENSITYDIYTNTDDSSVSVKVENNITDSII